MIKTKLERTFSVYLAHPVQTPARSKQPNTPNRQTSRQNKRHTKTTGRHTNTPTHDTTQHTHPKKNTQFVPRRLYGVGGLPADQTASAFAPQQPDSLETDMT